MRKKRTTFLKGRILLENGSDRAEDLKNNNDNKKEECHGLTLEEDFPQFRLSQ